MATLYQRDLAYVHASAFESRVRSAAREIILRLRNSSVPVRRVLDAGCGAGPLTKALVDVGFEVIGVDTSAELLEIARANVPEATSSMLPSTTQKSEIMMPSSPWVSR